MLPTDIRNPDYFHKVVDCQWACPAHTPVPEYIRLISAGRYADAYMVNWQSNVFPGILGRTCDRPCEPACRRGRVEEEPVAICRLKRVAADYKGDISARLPVPAANRNGKRVALVGAGPASLTVARDLTPLGYEVVVFDEAERGGGMIRSQIPKFRLPESVIDEEVGYVLGMGVETRFGTRIDSLRALLEEGFDAVFAGSGAPRGRDLEIPGRQEAAARIHIGIDWLSSVSFGHITEVGKRVIVLGGGNTAMDCCRSARRLGGTDVKVVVRSGFQEMKASPWEKDDAMHEDIPILNYLVPKEFTHEGGCLTGVLFEKMRAEIDEKGRRKLVSSGEPDEHIPCDDVLVAVGQENAFPWIERDIGLEFDRWDMPVVDEVTFRSTHPKVFFGGDAAFGPKNIIWAVAHGHQAAISIDLALRGEALLDRPPPKVWLSSQKMGIHEWSYDNDVSDHLRYAVPHQDKVVALSDIKTEVELGFDLQQALGEAQRCLNCDVQTVFTESTCIECDACVDICPVDCISFTGNGDETELRAHLNAPSTNLSQDIYVSDLLKTGRVMVKDEDVCLHCGLCAERCPYRRVGHATFSSRYGTGGTLMLQIVSTIDGLTRVNDFVVKFANVNGSGSASANQLFAKSILRMGVPVAPRNIFPSNIQGLPTWYEMRISEAGYLGAREGTDLMVAMNPQTWDQDVASIVPGGYLFYDSTKPMPTTRFRNDVTVIGMPLTELCNREYSDPRQRQLFKNIIYVGALAALLNIEIAVLEALIGEQFKAKEKLIAANIHALHIGRDYALSHLQCPIGLTIRRSDAVGDRISIEGNAAAGLGAVYASATVCAWYPITPSTSLAEAFQRYCSRYRVDKATGENRFAIVQAEDELASIGMVIGAAWNGARAFTATSGPGISLMQEFFGLAYFAEIPAVIFDVQRAGPSTGMPTRTQQCDVLACAYASHGDTKHVLLFPEDPYECFTFGALAFDLADRLQTPVFVLLDLDIGMNERLVKPLAWDDTKRMDRGKVMTAAELEAGREFGRYLDVDGDGIAYRTYPGTHPSRGTFFTRGTSKDRYARYTESGAAYEDNMQRLLRKFATAAQLVPAPEMRPARAQTRFGVIYYGSTAAAMHEANDLLAALSIELDLMRVRGFPFNEDVRSFINTHEQVFVVEQNRDGQLRMLLTNELEIDPAKLRRVLHFDGSPITARMIAASIEKHVRGNVPERAAL